MMTKTDFLPLFENLLLYHDKAVKKQVLSFYYDALNRFSLSSFKQACHNMKASKKVGQFPTVNELEEACRDLERLENKKHFPTSMTQWESNPKDIEFGKECLKMIYALSEKAGDALTLFKKQWFENMQTKYAFDERALSNIAKLREDLLPMTGEVYVRDVDF